jgi:phosphatidylglycerophosphate synthase
MVECAQSSIRRSTRLGVVLPVRTDGRPHHADRFGSWSGRRSCNRAAGFWAGLALVLASRLADGLDGAVARATQKTDRGGYLDIVCDYAFYAAVPLGFAIADPAANAVAACAMLFSFYINGGSFLGYAILAEKHGLSTDRRGSKSLYFTGGLAEGTETIAVFVIACLAPIWFPWLAYGFTVLVMLTAIARILMAWQTFRP